MAGTRGCLGSSYAMLEMMLTIPILLSHFKFNLLPGFINQPYTQLTIVPKGGLPMMVKKIT